MTSMRLIQVIIIGFVLAGPVFAGEKQFIDWWKNYDEQVLVNDDSVRHYRKKIELSFDSLREYSEGIDVPPAVDKEIETALVLYEQRNRILLLVTPENIMKNMTSLNEEYKQTIMKCAADKSWIVMLPGNEWTEIDLNPYCSMDYGEDEITLDLYWADSSARPFIDVTTSGLTCVPHHLYGWDRETGKYELLSTKCTGRRTWESYKGAYSKSQQLFLPGMEMKGTGGQEQ